MNKQLISAPSYQNDARLFGITSIPTKHSTETGVIFIGGFERSGNEQKWRVLSELLYKQGIASLQFDMTGLGHSTGAYNNPVMDNLTHDTDNMLEEFKKETGINNFCVIGHSLGACVALMVSKQRTDISKLVFLAPALNQTQLNRYRYTMSNNKDIEITLDNYINYFNEDDYQKYISKPSIKKANTIESSYMQIMSESDYSKELPEDTNSVLVIQGDRDNVVPPQSINLFANITIIGGGDHDLEKPGIIDQWVNKVVDFIRN